MKMNKLSFVLAGATIALAVLTTSCGEQGSSYKKLQNSYDSLLLQNSQDKQDLNEALDLINEVEANIAQVADAENRIAMGAAQGDLNESTKDKLRSDIQFLTQTLQENKQRLAQQEKLLKDKDINVSSLTKKIQNLQAQITEKETVIAQLQQQIAGLGAQVALQDSVIGDLKETQSVNKTTIAMQDQKLNKQDALLHTAYYCFGTASELKEQNILAGGGLFSKLKVMPDGFNKDYFMAVDTRSVSSIALFAKKALLRTNHPSSSYRFDTDGDGNKTLRILDPKEFWSKGKYLVIEVEP